MAKNVIAVPFLALLPDFKKWSSDKVKPPCTRIIDGVVVVPFAGKRSH